MWVRYFIGWLIWIAGALGVLLAVALTLVWWALVHPADAWTFTQKHFLPKDLQVTWQEIHWKPEKQSWLHWSFEWEVKGLHIEKASPKISAPVDEAAVVFSFSIFKPATHADFAKVILHATQPVKFQASTDTSQDQPQQSPFEMLRSYLHYLELGNKYATMHALDVQVKEFHFLPANGSDAIVVNANVQKPGAANQPDAVKFAVLLKSKSINGGLDGWLNAAKMGTADTFLSAKASFDGYKIKAEAELNANYDKDTLTAAWKGPLSYQLEKSRIKLSPQISITADEHHGLIKLITSATDIPGPLVKLDKVEAQINVPFQNGETWSEAPADFSVSGPVDLFFIDKNMRPPLERSCVCQIPERLHVTMKGKAWTQVLMAANSQFKKPAFQMRASVESLKNQLFAMDLAADIKVFKEKTDWVFEPKLDSEFHIRSFRGLKNFLDARNILIPAPFDVMDGTIDVVAKSSIDQQKQFNKIPVDVKVAIGSEHQKIAVDAQITADLPTNLSGMNVGVKLLVDDFIVDLPPLDPIGGIPKFTRDERIELAPAQPKAPSKFKVAIMVEMKTTKNGAIRLQTKYAKPYIPITVSAQRAMDGQMQGTFQFEPFNLQYLRRTVHVESMRILMDSQDSINFPVDGRLRVDQTQYRIFIDVNGTLRAPAIILRSEPYLPRSEIISVLLYDRTSDQLVSGDAETVGHFEAAMADRAIGLFGLWALASTPIKSFSYNPVTKVYAATVQLGEGLSASIGTDWEEATQLEVRKRVSKRWVLTASWSPSEADRSQVGRLVLQWEKRF
jgi:hypothetical protein